MTSFSRRPATLLSREEAPAWRGAVASALRFRVPLNHARPDAESIELFAREVREDSAEAHERPWLVYLQGGPGFEANRPTGGASGWLKVLLPRFRVLLLDQRGTGLSSPIDARSLEALGGTGDQLAYLRHFRAPDIVADAEAIRVALGVERWSTLGQSYGGFITLSYLSFAPEALERCLVTGGLSTLGGDAGEVYRATYQRMSAREDEFLARHPGDEARLAEVYGVVRELRSAGTPERLPDGREVTEATIQRLGMYLGGNTRIEALHFLLEGAVASIGGRRRLSAAFLEALQAQHQHAAHPLYWLLQENIYTSGPPTHWAAERVRAASFPEHLPDAARPRLLGEMALPQDYVEDPSLAPLAALAHAIADAEGWSPLYDLDALAGNTVPVAAAVYRDDVYVDRDLSLRTAGAVRGLKVWESDGFHHDGLADDPERVLGELLALLGEPLASAEA